MFDGTPITWSTLAGALMVDGRLEDTSDERILEGSFVGLFARSLNESQFGGEFRCTEFQRYDGIEPPVDPGDGGDGGGPTDPGTGDEEDEPLPVVASIVVAGETDGKTGTLETPLSWPIQVTRRDESGQIVFETGHVAVTANTLTPRDSIQVTARGIRPDQRKALERFWEDHDGPVIPFDWRDPRTGSTYPARFVGPRLLYSVPWAQEGASTVEEYAFEIEILR
ncbi:MAG: hypothetical protein AAFP86_07705 [Planctomycetota bacterium]